MRPSRLFLPWLAVLALGATTGVTVPDKEAWARTAPPQRAKDPPATSPTLSTEAEPAAVARELDRTDYAIQRARRRVAHSGKEAAIQRLAEAVRLQEEGRTAYAENLFARAGRLTGEARARARDASVLVGPAAEDPAFVERALKNAEQALEMAQDVLRDDSRRHCASRLEALTPILEEARTLRKQGALKASYERSRSVRDSILEILRACPPRLSERDAQRYVDRARASMDWARGEVGDHPKARAARLLREAEEQIRKAHASLERDVYRDALVHAKVAERILEEALSAQRENGPDRSRSTQR